MTHNILLTTIVGGGLVLAGVLPGHTAPRQNSFGSFQQFSQQRAGHQNHAMKPAVRSSVRRQAAPVRAHTPPRHEHAARLREAHAARGLAEMKDAADTIRNLPGFDATGAGELNRNPGGDLTRRDRGLLGNAFEAGMANRERGGNGGYENPYGSLMPKLPSNNSYGAGLRPSADLRRHMGGAAGNKEAAATPKKPITVDGEAPRPQGALRTVVPETGTVQVTTRFARSDGTFAGVRQLSRHRDGTSTLLETAVSRDGSGEATYTHYDSRGNVTDSSTFPIGPLDRTQDPNADADTGGIMGPWVDVRPSKMPEPVKVNPGTADNLPTPEAPRLKPGNSIVVNPSLTETAGPDRALDPATARRMFEAAKPGPGSDPPKPGN